MYLEQREKIQTSLTIIASSLLWFVAFATWLIAWIVDERYLAALSILIVAAAATLTVRSFVMRQAEELHTALIVTGRDVVRPHPVP